jgi:hypothetical protein
MMKLRDWIKLNEIVLEIDIYHPGEEILDLEGFTADCEGSDWSLFISPSLTIQDDHSGCHISDSLYSVTSYPTHSEIRNTTATGKGLEAGCELYDAVADALNPGDSLILSDR